MTRRNTSFRNRVLLLALLVSWPAAAYAGMQQSALEPESANEARLNRLQPPDEVMDAIGLEEGMTVAEIGAGRGRYIVHLAVRVGEEGKVYAEDINRAALRHCENRCRRWGLDQVETIVGGVTDPRLPEGELDLIFIVSAYHHFADPVELMRNARQALRPDGRVAIVEWLPEREGDPEGRTPERMESEMSEAGYRLIKTDPRLEENNLMIYLFSPDGT
jgi:ubiquinone/menaquinone biosynthesis C-methylase UbiE